MTTLTLNAADVNGQSAYVASQVSDLQSKMAALTTAVTLAANPNATAKMSAANDSATELFDRLKGAADFLSAAGGTPSGGSCDTHKYND